MIGIDGTCVVVRHGASVTTVPPCRLKLENSEYIDGNTDNSLPNDNTRDELIKEREEDDSEDEITVEHHNTITGDRIQNDENVDTEIHEEQQQQVEQQHQQLQQQQQQQQQRERFRCHLCPRSYANNSNRRRHLRVFHNDVPQNGSYKCTRCEKTYRSGKSLGSHTINCNLRRKWYKCTKCSNCFIRKTVRDQHEIRCSIITRGVPPPAPATPPPPPSHPENVTDNDSENEEDDELQEYVGSGGAVAGGTSHHPVRIRFGSGRHTLRGVKWKVEKIRECLNVAVVHRATPSQIINTVGGVFHAMKALKETIIKTLQLYQSVKIYFNVEGIFEKPGETNTREKGYLHSGRSTPILPTTDIDEIFKTLYKKIVTNMVKFRKKGSGRTLVQVQYVDMTIYEYDSLRASGGDHTEIISASLRKKRALIDVQSDEVGMCFKWSFIAAIKKIENDCRKEDLQQYENEFDFSSLQFPVDVYCDTTTKQHTFRKFEADNNVVLNIYTMLDESYKKKDKKKKKMKKKKKNGDKKSETTTTTTQNVVPMKNLKKKTKKNKSFIIREAVDDDEEDDEMMDVSEEEEEEDEEMKQFLDDSDMMDQEQDPSFFININRTILEKKTVVLNSSEEDTSEEDEEDEEENEEEDEDEENEEESEENDEDEEEEDEEEDESDEEDDDDEDIGERIVPIRISEAYQNTHHVNLLVVQNPKEGEAEEEEEEEGGSLPTTRGLNHWSNHFTTKPKATGGQQHHYLAINNMSRLLRKQITKHNAKVDFCYRCLTTFHTTEGLPRSKNKKLQEHYKFCKEQKLQRIRYPSKKEELVEKFKSHHKRVRNLFVGYCDFEACLQQNEEMKKVDTRTGQVVGEDVEVDGGEEQPSIKTVRGYDEIDDDETAPDYHTVRGYDDDDDDNEDDTPNNIKVKRARHDCEDIDVNEKDDQVKQKERIFAEHLPVSFGAKIVSEEGVHDLPFKLYKGENPALECIDYFVEQAKNLKRDYIDPDLPHSWSKERADAYKLTQNNCYLCNKTFEEGEKKCLDHNHLTTKVRGVACNDCNLAFRVRKNNWKLPVFVHNISRYDSKFLINAVKKRHGSVKITPGSMERFISFSVGDVIFLDSYLFLADSLENLAKDVLCDEIDWRYVYDATGGDARLNKFVKGKLPFPYTYFDSIEKLKSKTIPTFKEFHDTLRDEDCTPEKYAVFEELWSILGSFEAVHDFYLKLDVLLLTDIGEKFRNESIGNFSLDPSFYYSLPGYSWDAMLYYTKVELELLSDEQMYTFFEKSIRGGICQAVKRYSRACNPYLPDFQPSTPIDKIVYLLQLDANNLYALSLRQYLPHRDFKWVEEDRRSVVCDEEFIKNLQPDADKGYAYEVSVHIPVELHETLSDLPPLPEKITIDSSMLSDFQNQCYPDTEKQPAERLSVNLFDKSEYVMHYRTLQMCYALGLKITAFHRVIEFTQTPWMRTYIDLNTQKRTEAAKNENKFLVSLHKAYNNYLFGRSIMNCRKFQNVRVVTNKRYAKRLISNPLFKRAVIINESLMLVEMSVASLTLNRPVYAGFSVLEMSKEHMYDFFYSYVKRKYPGKQSQLCYMDTDSFLLEIHTPDVYQDMVTDSEWFDFSEYPYDAEVFKKLSTTTWSHLSEVQKHVKIVELMDKNQKVLGKFKDEQKSLPIDLETAIRSKSYALRVCGLVKKNNILTHDYQEKYKNKSICRSVVETHITVEDYTEYLWAVANKYTKNRKLYIRQNLIKSKKCQLYNISQQKIALAGFDLKRMVCSDNINTKALGYRGSELY